MNRNLLIVGAGIYGVVAKEIADSMKCFDKIDFVDDEKKTTLTGSLVVGRTKDLEKLKCRYSDIIVAIGSPNVRMSLLKKLEEEAIFNITTLVSPSAYVSSTAQIMPGCIVEPMSVIQSMSIISNGCIISAGAVVNHDSVCCEGVHVDCNATVAGATLVPAGTKIKSGEIYDKKTVDAHEFLTRKRNE